MRTIMVLGAAAMAVAGFATFAGAQTAAGTPPSSGTAAATQAQQDAAAVVATIGKNMQALTSYTYQQKVQMAYDGTVKSTTLNQISFDATGKPVVTQLSQSTPDDSERRLGHRAVDKKKDEIAAAVKDLAAATKGYLVLDKAHLEQVAKTAAVSYEGSNIILAVKNLMQQGDAVTITALASNMSRVSMQVTTTVDKNPATINVTYANLDSGLNYSSHYVSSEPAAKIDLTVDTLNYAPKQ